MDPSSDYHFLNQILWRRVKLTLVCGVFEGVLQHVDPNKILVLKKVKNVETGRCVPGVKMFFGHEIVNVELLDEVEQGAVREKTSSVRDSLNMERTSVDKMQDEDLNASSKPQCEPASPDPGPPPMTLLNDLKYNPSEEEEVTYTVIDQFQQKFGAAMLHIKKQTVLSVAMAGANVCRHGKLCWLQVASNSRVYLFDIFLLGRRAFNNGLQMILEDKRILKVIHDCRWLSDCLSHQYGIMLNNVFDTQVADVLQFSMETGGFLPNCISTLQESLVRHLKVVPKHLSFLEEKQKLIQENPDVWFTRPLSPSLLKILALEATYLLPLRLVLLDEMMSDLTTLVDSYLNTYREGSADRLGSTAPTCMELPEELLQLKDFQKQRQEKATKEYSVNTRGLLVRSPLQAKKPAAETTGREEKVQGLVFCKNSRTNKAPSFTSRQSHQDTNLLKVQSMSKQTTKPQHVPPQREGGWEAPHTQLHCPEPMGSEKQRAIQQDPRGRSLPKVQATSLKEEIEQLLQMMEIQDGHACTKQAVAGSPVLPQVGCPGSPEHSSHPTTRAGLPAFPPCPALERVDSWTNLSPHLS